MSQHNIDSLPKWAQTRIKVAEDSAEYWRQLSVRAERGDTEVFVQHYPNDDVGLPPGSTISFMIYTPDRKEMGRFDVSIKGGTLEVRGVGKLMMDQLRTIHRSSNVFQVQLLPWKDQ